MIEGSDVPFISSLVLRPLSKLLHPLNFSIYHQNSRPLVTVSRRNYGARNSSEYLRYSGSDSEGYSDVYDRIWEPDTDGTPLVTTQRTDFGLGTDNVPISVMQTARADNESFSLRFNVTAGSWYFYCQYFAEISPDVNGPGQRVFENADKNYSYTYKNTYDSYKDFQLYSTLLVYASHGIYVDFPPKFEVQLIRSNTSINGPIINAIEVFRYLNKDLSLGTINQEVSVVTTITESFGGLRSWNGDPCLPYAYNWLACSSDERPSINEIHLANQDLNGEIPSEIDSLKNLTVLSFASNKLSGSIPDLSSLSKLKVLDLRDNNLSGQIPPFLGELPALEKLDLSNNNLDGVIPEKLLTKALTSIIDLRLAGNENVCIAQNAEPFCNADGKPKKQSISLIVGISIASVATFVGVAVLLFFARRYSKCYIKPRPPYENGDARNISYKDIQSITNNFENEVGRGGFGPVYRGAFKNGGAAAVKVLSKDSTQGQKEFRNEVRLLSRVHHAHLVKLLGYCTEPELVLVYEFMANGSLFDSLHGGGELLTMWKDRLRIAGEAAAGCDPPIVHRDVKSSNILINGKLCAKVSDFGISKSRNVRPFSMSTNEQQMWTTGVSSSTAVRGTPGYIDPLYVESRVPDASVDVYAFGVVLFEIVTGRKPITQDVEGDGKYIHIAEWAKSNHKRGQLSAIIDPRMSNVLSLTSVLMVVDLAVKCLDMNKKNRPNMSTIKQELQLALSVESNKDPSTTKSFENVEACYMRSFMHAR
ncbi:hypothetical protein KP509_33G022200 [Ceratopteris richardii]|uniref:non-specific serine/threonine protein kinase n=1 Tax=Ceratopteris richardii TaxID=49495 RepID=A0A8T2QNW4_CERRI|nr:hypothetical protein KP509_33G022200 [Ceratopteris richardii]